METTLIIVKPDGVARRHAGRIISRFEDKGLQIAGMKLMQIDESIAKKHYAEHEGKPFYDSLMGFITRGPAVVLAIRGLNAISICRKMIGSTFGSDAESGTIRGDYGVSRAYNLIHGSDSADSAARELELYFGAGEIIDTPLADLDWVYDVSGGSPE